MSIRKRCFCIDVKDDTRENNAPNIEAMTITLGNAIRNESKKSTDESDIEGFDCEEICTGKKKNAFETNESKNIILIFGLILFYYFIRH